MEHERRMIREQEAAAKEMHRRKELGLDKEPVPTPVQVTFGRLVQAKPPAEKARMLKNSNLLSQIHLSNSSKIVNCPLISRYLVESSIKSLKAPSKNELMSKEFLKNREIAKSHHNRARSHQLKPSNSPITLY